MIRWLSIFIAGFFFLLALSSCSRLTLESGATGASGLHARGESLSAPGDLRVLWGINIDNPQPYRGEFDLAAQQGKFRWVRLWFWWRWLEPVQGQIDWSPMDAQVSWARENGMQIMASFAQIPSWANGSDPNCDFTTRGDCMPPPKDPSVWADFVSQAVRRYHDDIHYWNVWNEPNLTGSFSGTRNDFIGLMEQPAIHAIRSLDPTAKIVGPELAQLKPSWLKELLGDGYWDWRAWLRDLMYYGDGSSYDVISEHTYQNRAGDVGSYLDDFHDHLVALPGGAAKPVWLTETGFNSVTLGETQQAIEASNLVDVVEARPWVEHAFYFDIADAPDAQKARDGLALVHARPDLTPKPAFWALTGKLPLPPTPDPYQPNDPALAQDFVAELERYVGIDRSWQTDWDGRLTWFEWQFYYQQLSHALGPDSDPPFLYTNHQPADLFTLDEWWSFANEGVRLADEPISRQAPAIQSLNFRTDVSSPTLAWFEAFGTNLVRAPGEQVLIHVACFDSTGARKIPDGGNDPYVLSPSEYIEAVPNSQGQDQFNFHLAPQGPPLSCLVRIYLTGTDSFGASYERDSGATDGQAWFTLPAASSL